MVRPRCETQWEEDTNAYEFVECDAHRGADEPMNRRRMLSFSSVNSWWICVWSYVLEEAHGCLETFNI